MKLAFHGANRGVTGSCHLVECNGKRILIDCGLYQGTREIAAENQGEFGFDPASIDFLLLTHAHLDHCGRIPLLVKRGFKGEIITSAATRELARLVMLDSAGLQEEDARYRTRRARMRGQDSSDITVQKLNLEFDKDTKKIVFDVAGTSKKQQKVMATLIVNAYGKEVYRNSFNPCDSNTKMDALCPGMFSSLLLRLLPQV